MHIVTTCEYWDPADLGGSGRVSQELARCWVRDGHTVTSVAAGPGAFGSEDWHGVNRVHFPYAPTSGLGPSWRGFRRGWRRALRDGNPDVLVAHQPLVMLAARAATPRRTRRIPCAYIFHSPWAEEYTGARDNPSNRDRVLAAVRRRLERRALSGVSHVITLSRFMRQRLTANHPSLGAEAHVIPGGVALPSFPYVADPSASRARFGAPPDVPLLVTVRRLVKRVGIDNLLRAMADAPEPLNRARLLIGGRGPMRHELEQLADDLGLRDRVEFLGKVDESDLPRLLGAADLFVMPTRALEGFGLTTVEAMACGTPVAATPVGANPEIVSALGSDLVLPGAAPERIGAGLAALLSDPQRLRELRPRCRDLVESRYTWDRMASAVLGCFA